MPRHRPPSHQGVLHTSGAAPRKSGECLAVTARRVLWAGSQPQALQRAGLGWWGAGGGETPIRKAALPEKLRARCKPREGRAVCLVGELTSGPGQVAILAD